MNLLASAYGVRIDVVEILHLEENFFLSFKWFLNLK
jgi:hypothetical protein